MKRCIVALACAWGLLFGLAQPAQAAGGCQDGQYWAQYFNNRGVSGSPVVERCESALDNDWGYGSPVGGIPSDNFSIRWTSDFFVGEGTHRFTIAADDGVRFWIDGERVLDAWRDQAETTYTIDRRLSWGRHWLMVEYYEGGGRAVARLRMPGAVSAPAPVASTPTYFRTLPPGSNLPSGQECAGRVTRSPWEPRPENYIPNHTTPGDYRIDYIDGADDRGEALLAPRIDGAFTGTTDEIIRWGACKWGFDEDHVRAIAHLESTWRMSNAGDNGESRGLIQIKVTVHEGTYPWAFQSTAFNIDYALAWKRACFEGYMSHWVPQEQSRGDEYGCSGLWCSGHWPARDCGGYIGSLRYEIGNKPWLRY